MEYDRVGDLSDEQLGRALRAAIERSGDVGISLLVFSTNVRASIGCPPLYDDERQSIPARSMHEFANASNALISLGHAPRSAVELKRDDEAGTMMDRLLSIRPPRGAGWAGSGTR